MDDLTNRLQLNGSLSRQFLRDFVVSEVWDQYGSTDLVIGIRLNSTGNLKVNVQVIIVCKWYAIVYRVLSHYLNGIVNNYLPSISNVVF